MKVYDCFLFFNEFDLLEIRMNILNESVDYFVIGECSHTFTGKEKPLHFKENQHKFDKFKDKIIYVEIPKYENCPNAWVNEWYQRNYLKEGVLDADKFDVIMLSDVDEIPNPKIFPDIHKLSGVKTLQFYSFYYYLNLLLDEFMNCTRIFHRHFLEKYSMQEIREMKTNIIQRSGWHFSYLGGAEQIKQKIDAFAHQEYNKKEYLDKIEENINNQQDLFGRDIQFQKVKVANNFPPYLVENQDKYKHLIL